MEESTLLNQFNELYRFGASVDPNREKTGIDLFRYFEYGVPLKWIKKYASGQLNILDIGSSSTIWPVILHNYLDCTVHATDIDMKHLDIQQHYVYNSGRWDEYGKTFKVETQDATNLEYPDGIFDVVCSISAIEHIPGDGDISAFREAERVLKSGGLFILTAPSDVEFKETHTDHYHHGYEKRYDFTSIEDRFYSNKLKRKELIFISGRKGSDKFVEKWYARQKYNRYGKISSNIALRKLFLTNIPSERSLGFMALYQKDC